MTTASQARFRAFTLVELMVIVGLAALVGGIGYIVLNTGLILFAKNTSMNVAHQEARMAMLQMQREMYQAVSPIQLTDADGNFVSGDGPAAGISFHVFAAGPVEVTAKADAGQTQISVNLGSYRAKATDRLVIASHELETDLAQASAGTGNQVLTLAQPTPPELAIPYTVNITDVDDQGRTIPKPVFALLTERIRYRVKDGELLYEGPGTSSTILAREITSPEPFSRSKNINASTNPRFMAAINLSSGKDLGTGARRFKSTSMILNAEVPARAIICSKP